MTHPLPTIYRDTRERKPWHLVDTSLVNYEPKALLFGDYATPMQCVRHKFHKVPGIRDGWHIVPRFSIERKGISDYISSWHGGGSGESKKLYVARQASEKLGYQCYFWYVLDGFSTDIRARLLRHPWKAWRNGAGLLWPEVRAKMNNLRVKGYRVITCAHKLDAEENALDILTDFDKVHGRPKRKESK